MDHLLRAQQDLDTRGYFAVAKVAHVVPDPTAKDIYLALIEPGTYLDFPNPVPFNGPLGLVERAVLNKQGKISGRARSSAPIHRGLQPHHRPWPCTR